MSRIIKKLLLLCVCLTVFSSMLYSMPPFLGLIKWSETGERAVIVPDFMTILIVEANGKIVEEIKLDNPIEDIDISPDGNIIAYSAEREGLNIYEIATKTKKNIEKNSGRNIKWQPGSKKFIYVSTENQGKENAQIITYLIDSDGSNKKKIYSRDLSPKREENKEEIKPK